MNGLAARTSAPHNFFSIRMSSPTSRRTGSSSITISASPAQLAFPTHGRIGEEASTDFTETDLRRGFANTQKNHPYETFNVSLSRRIQITEKTAVKIRFDVVN